MKLIATETINPRTKHLGSASAAQIVRMMQQADAQAVRAVKKAGPALARAIELAARTYVSGHKIVFIGAGTSGRLGVLEAAECVPTFSTKPSEIVGIIAGGKRAMFRAQEGAEDNATQGAKDALKIIHEGDFIIGITASGITPYVIGALQAAKQAHAHTALMACNPHANTTYADLFIYLPTGPEVLNGSTRLKAGSATKMALNTLTTGAMARAGKVYQNLMVDVRPTNQKLVARAIRLICTVTGTDEKTARQLLTRSNHHVKTAIVMHQKQCTRQQAQVLLKKRNGFLAEVLREK